jgi:hypothetical protein
MPSEPTEWGTCLLYLTRQVRLRSKRGGKSFRLRVEQERVRHLRSRTSARGAVPSAIESPPSTARIISSLVTTRYRGTYSPPRSLAPSSARRACNFNLPRSLPLPQPPSSIRSRPCSTGASSISRTIRPSPIVRKRCTGWGLGWTHHRRCSRPPPWGRSRPSRP